MARLEYLEIRKVAITLAPLERRATRKTGKRSIPLRNSVTQLCKTLEISKILSTTYWIDAEEMMSLLKSIVKATFAV
jgi:hypothetical protein